MSVSCKKVVKENVLSVQVQQAGFAAVSVPLEIRSAARLEHAIKLSLGGG
jgi:hypothetical protein